jgi:hypothetical protein
LFAVDNISKSDCEIKVSEFWAVDWVRTVIFINHRNSRQANTSGCSAAWLARLTGGQKVGGSNPLTPTIESRYSVRSCGFIFLTTFGSDNDGVDTGFLSPQEATLVNRKRGANQIEKLGSTRYE